VGKNEINLQAIGASSIWPGLSPGKK